MQVQLVSMRAAYKYTKDLLALEHISVDSETEMSDTTLAPISGFLLLEEWFPYLLRQLHGQ